MHWGSTMFRIIRESHRDTGIWPYAFAIQREGEVKEYYLVDREALLELADDIDVDADNISGGAFLRFYSNQIREAIGEQYED